MEWSEIAFTITIAVLVLLGAYIRKLRKLANEGYELYQAIKEAIEDRNITRKELEDILSEAKDVAEATFEIVELLSRKRDI